MSVRRLRPWVFSFAVYRMRCFAAGRFGQKRPLGLAQRVLVCARKAAVQKEAFPLGRQHAVAARQAGKQRACLRGQCRVYMRIAHHQHVRRQVSGAETGMSASVCRPAARRTPRPYSRTSAPRVHRSFTAAGVPRAHGHHVRHGAYRGKAAFHRGKGRALWAWLSGGGSPPGSRPAPATGRATQHAGPHARWRVSRCRVSPPNAECRPARHGGPLLCDAHTCL